jgi:cytochrome P450
MSATETGTVTRHQIDFDHHAAAFRDRCPEVIQQLHATGCPLAFSPQHGGFWAIYGYDAVYDAVQDPELFSSIHNVEVPKGVPSASYPDPLIPIDVDGPMVHEYRRVVLSWFSPGGAKGLEPRIREIATELIDEFIERGEADLTQELLTPLPARLILELLGWEADRWPEWIEWIHATIHDRTEAPEKAQAAVENIYSNIAAEITKHRDNLTDDVFSDILRARFDGKPFTDEQLVGYAFLLLLGGMDTTAGLTGNTLLELDRRPELRQLLIDDPSLLPSATEEFLRHDSPSFGLYRTITRDEVFHGQQLRKGERAILMFPAAGLDPTSFDRPDEIDFDRSPNRHMAFGLGVHRCLGSHHARVMFKVMLTEILTRLPDFHVSGEVIRFGDAGDVYAVRHLPVRFTPGKRSNSP